MWCGRAVAGLRGQPPQAPLAPEGRDSAAPGGLRTEGSVSGSSSRPDGLPVRWVSSRTTLCQVQLRADGT